MSEHIKIEGVGCARCVASVNAALEELAGVKMLGVQVGHAQVQLPDDAPRAKAKEAIEACGFEVIV